MTDEGRQAFRIGDWLVWPMEDKLVRERESVRIEPKAMEVLVYLASRPGEVVSRADLERAVWRGALVGYDAVTGTVTKLRKALGDDAREPSYIATIPKKGYRLLADPCREQQPRAQGIERPSIAVLAFDNHSGDPEQEYFADGISEDIITGLSRFHWFLVIARNSSFVYKGAAVDAKQVGRELGAHYVLQGSVRKAGDRVRVAAQLIDTASGGHIWAERYEHGLGDLFSLQDRISEAITTTVAPACISLAARQAVRKTAEQLDVWDCCAKGNWHLSRRSREDIAEAQRSFETALSINSHSTTALSGLAFAHCWAYLFGWAEDLDAVRLRALELARQAADLDDGDAWAHAVLAWVKFISHQLDGAVAEGRRALELNPSLALAESVLSICSSWRGDNDEAMAHALMARSLSPRDPAQSMWSFALASAEFGAANYEQAATWARVAADLMPEFPGAWRYLASSLGHLGKAAEARRAAAELLRFMPHDNLRLVRERLPSVREERMDRFVEGLRRAGLPE